MHLFHVLSVIVVFITGITGSAHAADVSYPARGAMLLSGEIRPGDAEIVASRMEKNTTVLLRLNTMGGDVAEAMKIVSLIKGARLSTEVDAGGLCASACFFLYLAGDSRAAASADEDGKLPPPQYRYSKIGYVGVHRPYLKAPSGDQASIIKQEKVMQKVRSYLVSEAVPQYLIDVMMSRPSNDIYWLADRDFDFIGEYSAGQEEALISKCGYQRIGKQLTERWTKKQVDRQSKCILDYYRENTVPIQRQFLTKLRTGWRPWRNKR